MIIDAILIDLLGSKALASISFGTEALSEELLQLIIDTYYRLMQESSAREFVTTEIEEKSTCICKVSDVTIIAGVSDTSPLPESDIEQMKHFQEVSIKSIEQSSVRDFKDEFEETAERILRTPIRICFITGSDPSYEDKSGTAVDSIIQSRPTTTVSFFIGV